MSAAVEPSRRCPGRREIRPRIPPNQKKTLFLVYLELSCCGLGLIVLLKSVRLFLAELFNFLLKLLPEEKKQTKYMTRNSGWNVQALLS